MLTRVLPSCFSVCARAGNVFGDQKTMKERIREQKRLVERSVRGLERDRANLERDEKKLAAEIKVRHTQGDREQRCGVQWQEETAATEQRE